MRRHDGKIRRSRLLAEPVDVRDRAGDRTRDRAADSGQAPQAVRVGGGRAGSLRAGGRSGARRLEEGFTHPLGVLGREFLLAPASE
jgi:hypothetical protein